MLAAQPGSVVIDVGGVGLRVEVPTSPRPAASEGDELTLHTSLIVREDALTLFGFDTADELEMFGLLIAVNGVGPRSALGVLSVMTPLQIARAVVDEDDKPFRKVSGIGPKSSKMIAVSLAGKVTPEAFSGNDEDGAPDSAAAVSGVDATVLQGLIGLGWPEAVAHQAVTDARAAGAPEEEAGLLRAALALVQSGGARARGGAR